MGIYLTTKEFIKRSKKKHGNKYNYSLVDYKNSKTKIKIICKEHGVFEQRPYSHIQGDGCIFCAGTNNKTTKKIVDEFISVHGKKYEYSLVEYKNMKTKIKIICKEHGVFEQIPHDHLKGFGCASCGKVAKLSLEEFKKRASDKHNKVYDYSLVVYKNMHTKVNIICPKHGVFLQTPHSHLKFSGCPKCKRSKGEKIISWYLTKNNICFEEQKKFPECKKIQMLPFDFYLPNENLCIEFNGIQHYQPSEYTERRYKFSSTTENDIIKQKFCAENNIKLLIIKYTDKIGLALEVGLNKKLI